MRRPVLNEAWHSAAMNIHTMGEDRRARLAQWAKDLRDQAIADGMPADEADAQVEPAMLLCTGVITLGEFNKQVREIGLPH